MIAQPILKRPPFEPSTGLSFAPDFRLDLREERLWKGKVELRLRRKPFAILRYLVQHPRRLITHSEIVEAVWGGGTAMSESLVRTHIRDLRRVLGEGLIETVVGRGYRFMTNPREAEDRASAGLRLVHSPEPAAAATRSVGDVPIVQELAGVLAALGTNVTVLLIVGDAVSRNADSSRAGEKGADPGPTGRLPGCNLVVR